MSNAPPTIETLARRLGVAALQAESAAAEVAAHRAALAARIQGMRTPIIAGDVVIDRAPGGAPYVRLGNREGEA